MCVCVCVCVYTHTHTCTHTNIHTPQAYDAYCHKMGAVRLGWTYSSSWRVASTDIPDPLSPRLPIIHRLRQVLLQAILNRSWQQHPTQRQLYDHLPPITKTIQARRTRHAGHCWRSKDEIVSDVLLWTHAYGQSKAWTYYSAISIIKLFLGGFIFIEK